jgi:hypothetical protein
MSILITAHLWLGQILVITGCPLLLLDENSLYLITRMAPAGYGGGFATSIPAPSTSPRHRHPPPYPPAGQERHHTRPVTGTRDPLETRQCTKIFDNMFANLAADWQQDINRYIDSKYMTRFQQ